MRLACKSLEEMRGVYSDWGQTWRKETTWETNDEIREQY